MTVSFVDSNSKEPAAMNLVLSIGSLQGGGAERVACTLANAWATRGDSVTIVTMEPEDAVPAYVLSDAVRVRRLNLNKPAKNKAGALLGVVNSVRILRRAIAREKPDVVLSFIDEVNVRTIVACKGLGLPVIISERVHPGHYAISWFWTVLRRLTYSGASALVVQTRDVQRWCMERFGVATYVIPNPVSRPKQQIKVPAAGRKILAAAGRLMPQKRFDLLISAFVRVAGEFPEWDLVIYGQGCDVQSLEALVLELGMEGRVSLAGWEPDLAGKLAEAHAFCLSSSFEGFPNVLCEAMSLGLPVVATDCHSGPADIITDGEDGLLVPVDDEKGLVEGLRRVMGDEFLRSRLSEKAKSVAERFGLERILDTWQDCFDRYMQKDRNDSGEK